MGNLTVAKVRDARHSGRTRFHERISDGGTLFLQATPTGAGGGAGVGRRRPGVPRFEGQGLSDATIGKLLRQRGIDAVPHGFQSSFRDWGAERTDFPAKCFGHRMPLVVVNSPIVPASPALVQTFPSGFGSNHWTVVAQRFPAAAVAVATEVAAALRWFEAARRSCPCSRRTGWPRWAHWSSVAPP